MNGKLERAMRAAGVWILVASLAFVACLAGPAGALLGAPLLSAAAMWLWLHFELPDRPAWYPPLALTLAVAFAAATVETMFRHDFWTWFAPLLAAAAAVLTWWLLKRSQAQCNLCGRRLGSQEVVFRCPRCSMKVCDESCWDFEHRRCHLCLEQRVAVLPLAESWWNRAAGPRAQQGRCQICMGTAQGTDLRSCPQCRRPQCRECWDFNNGECARCSAPLPDLPPSLSATVAEIAGPPQAFSR